MTAPHVVDLHGLLGEAQGEASRDLMRNLLQDVINALLSADSDAVAAAERGRLSPRPDCSVPWQSPPRPRHPHRYD